MTYQPLARKYRPVRFEEIVGQAGVAQAMTNGIRLGRIPGAVIFSGVRGVGKTTLARLFAKALNCEKGPTPEPCGTCDSCQAIAVSTHEDVLEIDGASHTGVDDVRALQETMAYSPRRSRYKIYLIDEVHMLSMSAFNALLKTIEETPPHVKFIFATTELSRVPDTIQSRCQVFYLKKIPVGFIVERLKHICQQENIPFEERAIDALAQAGRGSLRDALTLLDQAIARGHGEVAFRHVLGSGLVAERSGVIDLLTHLVSRNMAGAAGQIARWDEGGCDFAEVVEECARYARHAFVLRHLGSDSLKLEFLGLEAAEEESLRALANAAGDGILNGIFKVLVNCREELQGATLDRFVFENNCFEWCLAGPESLAQSGHRSELREGPENQNPSIAATAPRPQAASPAAPPQQPPRAATERRDPLQQAYRAMTNQGSPAKTNSVRSRGAEPAAETHAVRESAPAAAAIATAKEPPKDDSLAPPASTSSSHEPTLPTQAESSGPLEPPTKTPVAAAARDPHAPSLPATWRDLVDAWKKLKPLQARLLEEAYNQTYSSDEITLGVRKESMAASQLLQPEVQKRMAEEFRLLFGFQGQFRVAVHEPKGSATEQGTILDDKRRQRDADRTQLIHDVTEHPLTREALKLFGGTMKAGLTQDPGF